MWSQQNSSAAIHVPILLHSIIIALIARTQIAEADQEEEEDFAAVAISAVRNNQTKRAKNRSKRKIERFLIEFILCWSTATKITTAEDEWKEIRRRS